MIRYDSTSAAIDAAVRKVAPKWLADAAERTKTFIDAGSYQEKKPAWSKVKKVFMALQMNKCAFCERQFENEKYGKIEFDVEHFRPKSSVGIWPDPTRHDVRYDFDTGQASPAGYYWLPYELSNYAASCKVCNTNLKLNYFPVAKKRVDSPGDVKREGAFLCYPIGRHDDDPENLVTFVGTTAVPKAKSGAKRRRGQIIIDFFELNQREQLHWQRAGMIIILGASLVNVDEGRGDDTDRQLIDRLMTPIYPHTNCLRAFRATWARDPSFARKLLASCKAYYASSQGLPPPIT